MALIYAHCTGIYVFDNGKLKEEQLYSTEDILKYHTQLANGETPEAAEKLAKKHKAEIYSEGRLPKEIIELFNTQKYLERAREAQLLITKRQVADSVHEDQLLIQAISTIEILDKAANSLSNRLREWYELYNPEFSNSLADHEKFVELVLRKSKEELLENLGLEPKTGMGTELSKEDLKPVRALATRIEELYKLRAEEVEYIETVMEKNYPNLKAVAGAMIGAKLMSIAGSIERLSTMPASTVQLLGAEKALFRHLKTGARPPKYGILANHPLVLRCKKGDRGKVARALADKLSIAAKIDRFKGEFIGDKLKKELEKKFAK